MAIRKAKIDTVAVPIAPKTARALNGRNIETRDKISPIILPKITETIRESKALIATRKTAATAIITVILSILKIVMCQKKVLMRFFKKKKMK